MEKLLGNPWIIGGAITAILWLAAKFVDADKAYETGKKRGRWISSTMRRTKLGAKCWEKIEDFLQRVGMAYVQGLVEGLDADDKEEEKKDEKLA